MKGRQKDDGLFVLRIICSPKSILIGNSLWKNEKAGAIIDSNSKTWKSFLREYKREIVYGLSIADRDILRGAVGDHDATDKCGNNRNCRNTCAGYLLPSSKVQTIAASLHISTELR